MSIYSRDDYLILTLELIKVHEVEVEQEENCGDIVLRSVS